MQVKLHFVQHLVLPVSLFSLVVLYREHVWLKKLQFFAHLAACVSRAFHFLILAFSAPPLLFLFSILHYYFSCTSGVGARLQTPLKVCGVHGRYVRLRLRLFLVGGRALKLRPRPSFIDMIKKTASSLIWWQMTKEKSCKWRRPSDSGNSTWYPLYSRSY